MATSEALGYGGAALRGHGVAALLPSVRASTSRIAIACFSSISKRQRAKNASSYSHISPVFVQASSSSVQACAQISELSGSGSERRKSVSSVPRARLVAHQVETRVIEEVDRPLGDYMSLPVSQYSVLDAQRIERIDDNTFRCYVHHFKLFSFEVCPVLLVKVEQHSNGCCIRLLSCTLEGSPLVMAQNKKFSASMVNRISWSYSENSSSARQLVSDATIEVIIEVPFPFRAIPVELIESTGTQVLTQLLRVMLPRFLAQLEKDYRAWASGDSSRRPLGTGEL